MAAGNQPAADTCCGKRVVSMLTRKQKNKLKILLFLETSKIASSPLERRSLPTATRAFFLHVLQLHQPATLRAKRYTPSSSTAAQLQYFYRTLLSSHESTGAPPLIYKILSIGQRQIKILLLHTVKKYFWLIMFEDLTRLQGRHVFSSGTPTLLF